MKKGFTLIELLVVVAIIGILAAVGVIAYNGYTESAKSSTVKTSCKNVEKFIRLDYKVQCWIDRLDFWSKIVFIFNVL